MTTVNHKTPTLSASFKESSNISQAEYDPFMKVLTIKFKTGGEYDYLEVEKDLFTSLKKAKSAGRFFHAEIRGKYDFFQKKTNERKEKEKRETEE